MKILAITGIRSDYDLMSSLYSLINDDPEIEFKILVGGAHLSNSFGYSVDQIEQDGFEILMSVESLPDSNSKRARLKNFSNFLSGSIDVVSSYDPDLIVYAGDREDVMMGALLGGYLNIPTVHFYSGDHVSDGHIDNPIRHSAAKLSTAHVAMLEEHKDRLVAMGEDPGRVFVSGNLSLDNFVKHKPMSITEINKRLGLEKSFSKFALLIFHPTHEDERSSALIFRDMLEALRDNQVQAFVSYPNSDPGNYEIRKVIEEYQHDKIFFFYKNLEREMFLSIYKNSQFIIGNSSSGICEAASIPLPAINVGTRQTGRFTLENVIFVGDCKLEISASIQRVMGAEFLSSINNIINPYGSGDSTYKAYEFIKKTDFKSILLKKTDPLTNRI